MILTNKAVEEQITKGHHVVSAILSVGALLYVCACVSVRQQQGSKRMIQLCTRDRMKTSEEAFQPAGVIFTAIHGRSTTGLHWTYTSWQS